KALAAYEQSLSLQRQLVKDHPDVHEFRQGLAQTCHNVGHRHHRAGRYDDALASYREALTHFKRLAEASPGSAAYSHSVAGTLKRRELWPGNAGELYAVARDLALAAALAAAGTPERGRYEGLALETLRSALKAGYRDFEKLRTSPDLNSLRGRPEFEKLLGE